jgi:hypothetical protein
VMTQPSTMPPTSHIHLHELYIYIIYYIYVCSPQSFSHKQNTGNVWGGASHASHSLPWPPVFYTLSRMTRELLRRLTLLTLLNLLTNPLPLRYQPPHEPLYQPTQPTQSTIYIIYIYI